MIICDYNKCTGCMACKNICPSDAISMGWDNTYKSVPVTNDDKCNGCGACKKVCPVANEKKYNTSFKCYAAGAQHGINIERCSSGGISAAFCEYVINNGGVVFGAAYESGELVHVMAKTMDEAEKIKGSKYVQSNISTVFKQVKKQLESGVMVLFTGTPCQIAGLYGYLNKNYDNLITVDIICHGAPSSKFLNDYLTECGIYKYTNITFRQKGEYNLKVYNGEELVLSSPAEFDPYYRAFYNNITLRDNCFDCKYASAENRPSDITLGDFWGLDKTTLKNPIPGNASVILINTKKGEEFFEKINLVAEERELSEAVKGNAQLKSPAKYNADVKVFIENYKKGFLYAVNKTCVRKNIRANKTNKIKESIKHMIKKGLKL